MCPAESEHACDEAVLKYGGDPFIYTKMLVDLAKYLIGYNGQYGMTAGLLFRKSLFFRRVEAILHMADRNITSISKFGTVLLIMLCVLVLSGTLYVPLGMSSTASVKISASIPQRTIINDGKFHNVKRKYPIRLNDIFRDATNGPVMDINNDAWKRFSRYEKVASADGRRWSDDAIKNNYKDEFLTDVTYQHNFDNLGFDVTDFSSHIDTAKESTVTIRGKVIDPNGNPISEASVSSRQAGAGDLLNSGKHFSTTTGLDGSYELKISAGERFRYNLVAHDGKYRDLHRWGNGVAEPFTLHPGDVINGVNISLTRPASVSGTIRDVSGKPLANHWVRAHAYDGLGNQQYDPQAKTDSFGRFYLTGIRPGRTYINGSNNLILDIGTDLSLYTIVELQSGDSIFGIELVGLSDEEKLAYIKNEIINKPNTSDFFSD